MSEPANPSSCQCSAVRQAFARAGIQVNLFGVRCGHCWDGVLESKNQLVRENQELRAVLQQALQALRGEEQLTGGDCNCRGDYVCVACATSRAATKAQEVLGGTDG